MRRIFEKAQIVARLRSGRERKRQLYGRCEGRPRCRPDRIERESEGDVLIRIKITVRDVINE